MSRSHKNPFRDIIDTRAKANGWTLGMLAERIQVSPGQLSRYFGGENAMPDAVLLRITATLCLSDSEAARLRLARDLLNSSDAVRDYVAGIEAELMELDQCDSRLQKVQKTVEVMLENRAKRGPLVPLLVVKDDSSSVRKAISRPKDSDDEESSGFTKVFT